MMGLLLFLLFGMPSLNFYGVIANEGGIDDEMAPNSASPSRDLNGNGLGKSEPERSGC
ncbi:hypothetical protein LBR02_18290 [Levilactobacillus brevis]|nr:hypothetical protein LBR02_18290 [Levilactobacillus brevis]